MPEAGSPDALFESAQRALAGRYVLERELGRGGAAVVYLAREVELDRRVALKVLPPERAANTELRARFLREARTAAALSHPHIVPIYRVGEAGPIVYFTMEYVEGETLGERLRSRGPLAPSAAIRLLREVSQALAYAHGHGIVHRDIKTDNILLERVSGRALVTDFGIAAGAESSAGVVAEGTPHFMSPEQAAGLAVDARSDLYSLGVVAHLALSGMLPQPVAGGGGGWRSVADASPTTPRHLVLAVDRALRLDPAERFESAEAFAKAVEASVVVRPRLPRELREFLDARDPWRAAYIAWFVFQSYIAVGMASMDRLAVVVAFFFFLAALPALPALVFRLRTAGRLFESGYTVEDLREAFDTWRAEGAEEDAIGNTKPRWFHRALRALVLSALGLLALRPVTDAPVPFADAIILLGLGAWPVLGALGVPVLPRWLRPRRPSALRERFWTSRFGKLAERLLMLGKRAGTPAEVFRPTEVMLGTTVGDLFRALPRSVREELRELPATIDRLRQHAAAARAVLREVDEAAAAGLADAGSVRVRETARRELTDSVAAIEAIRLDLLRLLGRAADLRPSVTILRDARRVSDDLDRLRSAQAEVRDSGWRLAIDVRATTPV